MAMAEVLKTSSRQVGIVAANCTGYVETMFECMEAGDIAVPLRTNDDNERIKATSLSQIMTPASGGGWMKRELKSLQSRNTALISFTSGTEGSPKGVLLTHHNLTDTVVRLNSLMQLDHGIREYIGVPVYHSFGFGRCRAVATVGGQFFIPEKGFNPSEIAAMLRAGEINAISAVPSLWRVLLANKDLIGSNGKNVRWIEIGSQYMNRQEKEALKALFPEARIVQHYGLTEASRSTLLEVHAVEGNLLESVGQPSGAVEIKLSSEGRIAVRGNHVAQGYLIDGKEVKLTDEDGWFLTKDLGRSESGYLFYEGRADDVINCGGIKIHPEALETKIYASIGASNGIAVCRTTDPIRGEGILVAVTPEAGVDQQQLWDAALQATQALGVNAANAIMIVDVDHLPKTATGKVQRRQLAEWYASRAPQKQQVVDRVTNGTPIQTIFCRTLNLRTIRPQDTFVSLGGDSLSYVQISMDLEQYLGHLPQDWEQLSLCELESLKPQQQRFTLIETSVLLRALSITEVVLNHANVFSLGGGAYFLLMVAGSNFARFQGDALVKGRFIKPVFSLLKNLVIPYLFVASAYLAYKQRFDPAILLLFSNFVGPQATAIFPVWFVNVLVQSIIIFSILFYLKPIRGFVGQSPWKFGLICLFFGVAFNRLVPLIWDTTYLYDRVPHMLIWLFTLGWCIHFAQSKLKKVITTILCLVAASILLGLDDPASQITLIGSPLLIWVRYIKIPQAIKLPVQMIGASAYYIYLTHMVFIHLVRNIGGVEEPLLNLVAGLTGGFLTWMAVQFLQQNVFSFELNNPKTQNGPIGHL